MNKRIYFIILLVACKLCNAQTPNWQWAKSAGGIEDDYGFDIAVDGNGNSYITGGFTSDSITFGTVTLYNNPVSPNFVFSIVKYDPSGNVIWAKSAVGWGEVEGMGIAVDGIGNSYVTGLFQSDSVTFDSVTLINTTNVGYSDIFVVKYDVSGNVVWAISEGGVGEDAGFNIAADSIGNTYVTGVFEATFGSTTLHSKGYLDVFTVKFDGSGNVIWANSGGGTKYDYPGGIAIDGTGNCYVTGRFYSEKMILGSDTLINHNTNASSDIFIVKYDVSGNLVWAKSAGGTAYDEGHGIAADYSGNCYVTGIFTSDSITFDSATIINNGGGDIFFVKYDAVGSIVWAKGGTGFAYGTSVASDASGNNYLSGFFASSSITFGSTVLINDTTDGSSDIFIVKYDAAGNVVWAMSAGGNSNEHGHIAVDGSGNCYISGSFISSSIAFGSTTLINYSANINDIFIAKLNEIVGMEDMHSESEGLQIFPNPFSKNLNININRNELTEINFYDLTSRKILHQSFTNSISINTEQLAKGIYLYQVRNKNRVIKKGKVVKD